MNEGLFAAHIFLIVGLSFAALRLGETALIVLISLHAVLANLFVTQQISLFGLNATSGDASSVGVALGLNLLQESFGKGAVKRAIFLSMALLGAFLLFSLFQCLYAPSPTDTMQPVFHQLLYPLFRLGAASAGVYFLVQMFDRSFFAWLREQLNQRYPLIRIALCLLLSQFLDTVLFSFIGLWGLVDHLWEIIGISLCIKYVMVALTTVCLIPWSRRFTRMKVESL